MHLAWLADAAAAKAEHDQAKADISAAHSRGRRVAGRDRFMAMAATHGGLYQTIVDEERKHTKVTEEQNEIR